MTTTLRFDRLTPEHAGELLTLQRAAFVTEARKTGNPEIPALTQTLNELRAELGDPQVIAMGGWLGHRLVASVRIRIEAGRAEIARLAVAPDQRDQGFSTEVLFSAAPYLPERVDEVWVRTSADDAKTIEAYARFGFEHQFGETTERLTQAYLRKMLRDQ